MRSDLPHSFRAARAVRSSPWILIGLLSLFTVSSANGHVGTQNVIFETQAGEYPLRITIRPPEVVPGLAEIFVRLHEGKIDRISALPVRFNTGREGAPPPDEARPVANVPGLFRTELWFMEPGAYSVIIEIEGDRGTGEVMIPFDAIATRTLAMSRVLTLILIGLGVLLIGLASSIVGAAVRQAVLPPGASPSHLRIWGSRAATLGQFLLVLGLVFIGRNWWQAEEREYRNRRLYQPMQVEASLPEAQPSQLRLHISDPRFRNGSPLLPDHGKLMHLFLVDTQFQSFAHLHPTRTAWDVFQSDISALPEGRYWIFADLTHETGFSHTLTNLIQIVKSPNAPLPEIRYQDPDDSWHSSASPPPSDAPPEFAIHLLNHQPFKRDQETELLFTVRHASGRPAPLEPYIGMKSHLILMKHDASVFNHLHPSGTISMASLQAFEVRLAGDRPAEIAYRRIDPYCELPSVEESQDRWLQWERLKPGSDLTFPYTFPQIGRYQIWVQVKVAGQVLTESFEIKVEASAPLD